MGLFGGMIEGYDSSQRHKANEANLRYQEELRKRQQAEWARQDSALQEFERSTAGMEQGLNAPRPDFYAMPGLQAPMVNSGMGLTGSRELEGVQTPVAAPAMAPRNASAESALKAQMAIAKAGGKPADYFNAHGSLLKQRIDADAAAIYNAILNILRDVIVAKEDYLQREVGRRRLKLILPGTKGYAGIFQEAQGAIPESSGFLNSDSQTCTHEISWVLDKKKEACRSGKPPDGIQ